MEAIDVERAMQNANTLLIQTKHQNQQLQQKVIAKTEQLSFLRIALENDRKEEKALDTELSELHATLHALQNEKGILEAENKAKRMQLKKRECKDKEMQRELDDWIKKTRQLMVNLIAAHKRNEELQKKYTEMQQKLTAPVNKNNAANKSSNDNSNNNM